MQITGLMRIVLVAVVAAQVAAAAGQYGRLVWCIGENGHSAIEPPHEEPGCDHGCPAEEEPGGPHEPDEHEHSCLDVAASEQHRRPVDDASPVTALDFAGFAVALPMPALAPQADAAPAVLRAIRPPPARSVIRTTILRL